MCGCGTKGHGLVTGLGKSGRWLDLVTLKISSNLDDLILSYILSYPIVSYRILSYPIVSYRILSYPILSYPILSYPILSYPIVPSPTLTFHSIPFHSIPFHSIPFHSIHLTAFHSTFTWSILNITWSISSGGIVREFIGSGTCRITDSTPFFCTCRTEGLPNRELQSERQSISPQGNQYDILRQAKKYLKENIKQIKNKNIPIKHHTYHNFLIV